MMADGEGEVDSVNAAMDRSKWPHNRLLRVVQYTEALAILAGAEQQRRVRAWSLDCEAFYRMVGRQRRELWRNAMLLPSGVQLDERCCFGDASAATKCARVSNLLVAEVRKALARFDAAHPTRDPAWLEWQQRRRELAISLNGSVEEWSSLNWFGMYVDDGLGGSADDLLYELSGAAVCDGGGEQQRRAAAHFDVARAVLQRFGWESAPSKEVPPCTELTALGVDVSLADGRLRLERRKRLRYVAAIDATLEARRVSFKAFRELLGRLEFAAGCFPPARQYMHALWRAARAKYRLANGYIMLSPSVRFELEWWRAEMLCAVHPGVPLAQPDPMPEVGKGSAAIYADAAGGGGVMAWAVRGAELLYVVDFVSPEDVELFGLRIADLEMLASTWGLVTLAPELSSSIVSFTDNTVVLAALRRLSTKAEGEAFPALLRRRTLWLAANDYVEAAARVTSANNRWADLGSRGRVAEACAEAEALGLQPRQLEIPADWRDLTWLWRERA